MALTARAEWKEILYVFDEQGRTFAFDCGWGVSPPVAYIPFVTQWQGCVPSWLRERRDEAIDVMTKSGHVVHEGDYPRFTSS